MIGPIGFVLTGIASLVSLWAYFEKVVSTPHWGFNKNNHNLYTEAKKQFGDCVMIDFCFIKKICKDFNLV